MFTRTRKASAISNTFGDAADQPKKLVGLLVEGKSLAQEAETDNDCARQVATFL